MPKSREMMLSDRKKYIYILKWPNSEVKGYETPSIEQKS